MFGWIDIPLHLPQGRQLEFSGSVIGRNADDGATIVERALKDPAVDLRRLGAASLLAIGGIVGGDLYCIRGPALEGAAGLGFWLRANALDAEQNFQQIFLPCAQALVKFLGAGIGAGPALLVLGSTFHGRGLASDITLQALPTFL